RTTNLSNESLETLKIIKDCSSCKDNAGKYKLDKFHESSISEMENWLAELEKGEWERDIIICYLNDKLIRTDYRLNRTILCESCKGEKIEKLTDKCENEEIARFLYRNKL